MAALSYYTLGLIAGIGDFGPQVLEYWNPNIKIYNNIYQNITIYQNIPIYQAINTDISKN